VVSHVSSARHGAPALLLIVRHGALGGLIRFRRFRHQSIEVNQKMEPRLRHGSIQSLAIRGHLAGEDCTPNRNKFWREV